MPWYETQEKSLIEAARRNAKDEAEFATVLHHLVVCEKCRAMARKR